ncbi:MAG: gliding motility-associated C-terminal domain-containing protein [Sphingobacteriaceae bacterium]|nr:gliding motility-associated C-terminal domain-containing protein [Sphingobacteriaceae bacterium]
MSLFITSKVNATVNLDIGGTPYQVGAINLVANQPKAIVIDPNEYTNVYIKTENNLEIHPKKGIHVTADQPVVVYSHISHSARSAACLVYPTKALGHDYYAISYIQLADAGTEVRSSQITVLGVEDNTQIEITPTQTSRWLPARPANVPFTITLDKGDIYQFQSLTDITGSRIRTVNGCKPFSVFSGSTKNGFCELGNTVSPLSPNGQDNLYQQLLPVSAWGRNFVTAPLYNAHRGSSDIYRIQVANDNTTVTVNGSTTNANGIALSNPYSKGSVITFNSKSAHTISANNPINVTQFQTSQSCAATFNGSPVLGDPEMIILNPIEQTLKDITVYSAVSTPDAFTNINSHYINAIIKTADTATFTVDGISFQTNRIGDPFATNKFIRINDQYSYIVVDVTAASMSGSPSHRIRADGGFVAIAYGNGFVESYGYLAGSDLRNLDQFLQPENAVTNSPIINGCTKEAFKLYVVLPYKTTTLSWDLGDGQGIRTDTNPDAHYSTTTVNGQLSYKYRYFNDLVTMNAGGTYLVKAIAVNPAPITCDANEVIELSLTVSDPPNPDFTVVSQTCEGSTVLFTDKSNGNGLEITKWYWDFGDGTPIELRKNADPFTHEYTTAGDYQATLTVEGISGCQSSVSAPKTIHVIKLPTVDFTYALCDLIKFTDKSTPIEGSIVKWFWDFGDPGSGVANTSTEQHPSHRFSDGEEFLVTLTVETDKGCRSTKSLPYYSAPTLLMGDDITILRGGEKHLTATTTGKELKYKWVPATGLDNDTIPNPVASPVENTKYTLTVTSKAGCSESGDLYVTVVEPDIPNAFSPNGDGINDRWAIKYLETYVRADVQIFNRYGQKVYTSGQYLEPWDGTWQGKEIPVGVYYYTIEPNNGRKKLFGSITLLR